MTGRHVIQERWASVDADDFWNADFEKNNICLLNTNQATEEIIQEKDSHLVFKDTERLWRERRKDTGIRIVYKLYNLSLKIREIKIATFSSQLVIMVSQIDCTLPLTFDYLRFSSNWTKTKVFEDVRYSAVLIKSALNAS